MRLLLFFVFFTFTLTACGPTKQVDPETQANLEQEAQQLMQAGDYAGAAVKYLSLAEMDSQDRSEYRLKAVAAYIEGGFYDDAQTVLLETGIAEDDTLQSNRKQILASRLELEFGQPDNALAILETMSVENIPQGMKVTYHDLQSRAYLAKSDYTMAAKQRLLVNNYLATPYEIEQNNIKLWDVFKAIPDPELDSLHYDAPEELLSWYELASIYRQYKFQPAKLKNAVDGWIQHYPGHPAYSSIVPGLIDTSRQYSRRPAKVGLLLPFSGQYQKASTAVRDGFLAAWYLDNVADKSEVEIYNANSLNIVETYQKAVSDGVEYVVGPLEKEAVNRLIEYGQLPVQVLALNHPDTRAEPANPSNLVLFGLSPEDEARQVAEAAMSDGHTLALVMTPEIPWGQRIAEAFTERWVELGGGVLEQARFSPGDEDYGKPVKELLNIDGSERRAQELRSTLNRKIHAVERRRQDADFIFAAAVPGDARQLFPQFRFYRAGELPVYSTSHIFTGAEDEARDADMDGVIFLDMPWLLDTTRELSIIQDALNRNWSQNKSNYRRLYALGIDTYRLIPEITRLKQEKNTFLNGETGDLTINADNVVERKLRRAKFVDGKPVLMN